MSILFNELQDLIASESAHGVPAGAQTDIRQVGCDACAVVLHPADVNAEHLCHFMRIQKMVGVLFRDRRYEFEFGASVGDIVTAWCIQEDSSMEGRPDRQDQVSVSDSASLRSTGRWGDALPISHFPRPLLVMPCRSEGSHSGTSPV
jgi:hypothetical protein